MGALAGHSVRVAGGRHPRGHDARAQRLRRHRRHHRGGDDINPRGRRHRAHLGLPLLLAARRLLRGQRPQPTRRDADDGALPELHRQPRCGRRGRAPAARVRDQRTGRPRGAGDRRAPRLSRDGPGADRQSGIPAGPARRLRLRHPGRHSCVLRPAAASTGRRDPVPSPRAAGRVRGSALRSTGRGPLGATRRGAGAHLLEPHVLGGL